MRLVRKAGLYAWHSIVCLALLAWVVTAYWAVLYSVSVHRQHRAERLLQELKALQPGSAGVQSVQRLADEYRAVRECNSDSCTYQFITGLSDRSFWRWLTPTRTEWDYAGLRPWEFTAVIEVRNQQVAGVQAHVLLGRGRGWLYHAGLLRGNEWGWLLVFVFERHDDAKNEHVHESCAETFPHDPGEQSLVVTKPVLDTAGGGEALSVNLSPAASLSDRSAAFDMNLGCASAMTACTNLCQLAPSAWKSYAANQRSHGWYVDEFACVGR